ncbi:hypothetical protein QE152_g5340 [Popillia japonica]|uniref:Uncharacterized protein n=1 Tax=Popillia japonica TaxID=7064 RepID=A0AAW1ML44_POPJA
MAKKKVDFGKGVYILPRSRCNSSNTKYFKTISPTPTKNETRKTANQSNMTSSPTRGQSPLKSPRTSPGLLAGHYAGCKFTEPPLPSALPPPPKHWTMQMQHPTRTTTTMFKPEVPELQKLDIAHQLKVLLKVQA